MACLMAGMVGCGGGPPILFFPSRGLEAAGLEEGIGDHGHQGVSVQPEPGSAFEVVEAKLLLELLMRLFADPSGFDCGGECPQADVGGKIGRVYFCSPVDLRSPTSQTSSPGMHCMRLSRIRCLWPSATRTRRAANRQVSRPLCRVAN